MSAVLQGDDDNWASGLFSEQELLKLRQTANDIQDEHDTSTQVDMVSIETMFDKNITKEVLDWLRNQHYNAPEGAVADFMWAVGCNLCFAYLVDVDWEYDESLSDHATYFGARMFLEDDEDEDDVDDEDMDETDDDT